MLFLQRSKSQGQILRPGEKPLVVYSSDLASSHYQHRIHHSYFSSLHCLLVAQSQEKLNPAKDLLEYVHPQLPYVHQAHLATLLLPLWHMPRQLLDCQYHLD